MKLLITDDQNSVHMFFDRMLHYEELGITQVFHATNGEEALKIIKEEWPELMLLDIRMPVMDGLSLLEEIQDLPFGGLPRRLQNQPDFPASLHRGWLPA